MFLGIISIDKSGYRETPESDLKESMLLLLDLIYKSLRKGDVVTQWNQNQVLVLLFKLEDEDLDEISKRLQNYFNSRIKNAKINLNIKYKKI